MDIILDNIGKRYRYEWILRNINYHFQANNSYAVLGPNGSGKSTFLNILSLHLSPSKGKIFYQDNNKPIDIDKAYRFLSYAAPYIELIEEFTLSEAIHFHHRFKPFLPELPLQQLLELIQLPKAKDKPIKFFSSGMKQRLKLAFAICADTKIVLLDEPTTNLDTNGIQWYHSLIEKFKTANRLFIVASNTAVDYDFCDQQLNILDYKKK